VSSVSVGKSETALLFLVCFEAIHTRSTTLDGFNVLLNFHICLAILPAIAILVVGPL
jgi:hypothetical protein